MPTMIQDFNVFKELEQKGLQEDELIKAMEPLLGSKGKMECVPERDVRMNYSLSQRDYLELRNNLVRKYLL